jgi:hypothetical protein
MKKERARLEHPSFENKRRKARHRQRQNRKDKDTTKDKIPNTAKDKVQRQ